MRHSYRAALRPAFAASCYGFAIMALVALPSPSHAEELFGTAAVPAQALSAARGGDGTSTDSNNTVLTSQSTQNITATNGGNSAGGDVVAGAANIDGGSFTNMQGMTNVVVKTGPMANVQGIMSLNVVLH